ncbi:MAG: C40 family peptidase [Mycobacteriales bacterium]
MTVPLQRVRRRRSPGRWTAELAVIPLAAATLAVLPGTPAAGTAGAATAPTQHAQTAVQYAQSHLGAPYRWGGTGPRAFDCSGLVWAAYRSAGVRLPRTSQSQYRTGHPVGRNALKPGDLVFFGPGPRSISHVGIYVGGGRMIHSPRPGRTVTVAPLNHHNFIGATRL